LRVGPVRPTRVKTTIQEAHVRKVVVYTLMSLDGAVDHPGEYFALC